MVRERSARRLRSVRGDEWHTHMRMLKLGTNAHLCPSGEVLTHGRPMPNFRLKKERGGNGLGFRSLNIEEHGIEERGVEGNWRR